MLYVIYEDNGQYFFTIERTTDRAYIGQSKSYWDKQACMCDAEAVIAGEGYIIDMTAKTAA